MAVGNKGSSVHAELNRLANGGTYRTPLTVQGVQAAANTYAGTVGLDLLGALNRKAGRTSAATFVGLQQVANELAGNSVVIDSTPEALRKISS